jgi:hypothetical protein
MFKRSRRIALTPIVANTAAIVVPTLPNQMDPSTTDAALVCAVNNGPANNVRHDIYGICRVPDPSGGAAPQILLLATYLNIELVPTPVKYIFNLQPSDNLPVGAVFYGFSVVQTATVPPTNVEVQLINV